MPDVAGPATTSRRQLENHSRSVVLSSTTYSPSPVLDVCNLAAASNSEFPIPSSLVGDEESLCCICRPLCYLPKTRRPVCGENCFSTLCDFACPPIACDCCWTRWHRHRLPNENLLVLSIIQLLCGFASIILFSVALTKAVFLYRMATGMWAGFLMLIAGVQGLITARRPILCTIAGLLVVCALATLSACLLIGVSVAGTIEDGFVNHAGLRSKSPVFHSIKFTHAFHENDDLIQSVGLSGLDQSGLWNSLNWTSVGPFRLRAVSRDLMVHILDPHLRTCQVIIHVLLLLVGILDSSVSLSIAVLCCRYVRSHPASSWSQRNSQSNRTNIVSFDSATASQAAALLRSGDVNQFIGSGNLLLAVATDSLMEHESRLNRPVSNQPLAEPYLHHTVAPFLPESSRPALILTQAGTGSMAWTAARAAATLLDHNRSVTDSRFTEDGQHQPVPHVIPNPFSKRLRLRLPKRSKRPRLLFTSLNTPAVDTPMNPGNSDQPSNTTVPPYRPGSTLLYVIPSPTRDEPPMIFPPFPPTYSSLQRRPSTSALSRASEQALPRTRSVSSGTRNCPGRRSASRNSSLNSSLLYRIFSLHETRRRLWSRHQRTHHPTTRPPNHRTAASALMCAVDRLLQPVLIVEDPEVNSSRLPQNVPVDPPKYSVLEHTEIP
ncbi:hypothetical protein EG68_12525 [Paragonimus skrjabini miyazakii]|uniref:Transmembrane protein n=1 Tax=Paragonimus skrjabini miyazakii TaxID=59628 RepID=A0A8S9YCC7_9TREM|nr:hypothetical protein EG68_12525 [Paragonimus skrjabini miyazakii]